MKVGATNVGYITAVYDDDIHTNVGATEIVSPACLEAALEASLPSYRAHTLASNQRALEIGREAVEIGRFPAWKEAVA